ncbi:unnamed protein product, partial [Dovyalis caffra]
MRACGRNPEEYRGYRKSCVWFEKARPATWQNVPTECRPVVNLWSFFAKSGVVLDPFSVESEPANKNSLPYAMSSG